MHYHLKSKPDKGNRNKIIFVIVLFLLLSLASFLFPKALQTVSLSISKPVWLARGAVVDSFVSVKDLFVFKRTLIAKNVSLENELASLKLKEIDYEALTLQNQDLKNLLGRGDSNSPRTLSRILSKPPYTPYDILIIDIGSESGVSVGDRVYISGNILVGAVQNVTPNTSLVRLFSSGGLTNEAILSRTGESFALVGQGSANFKIEVPKDADIIWGDTFNYPNISPAVLGSVYYIDTSSQSSFKTVYLKIPGNVFLAKYVFVERSIK